MDSACSGCCFFFQAEDGIRDIGVTGVQTCALPISPAGIRGSRLPCATPDRSLPPRASPIGYAGRAGGSEERRVGKEYRPPREPFNPKKKTLSGSSTERGGGEDSKSVMEGRQVGRQE